MVGQVQHQVALINAVRVNIRLEGLEDVLPSLVAVMVV